MTAQMSDYFKLNGLDYTLITSSKKLPFNPKLHGFLPCMCGTACYKGWFCGYRIVDVLRLDSLHINTSGFYPRLYGKWPDKGGSDLFGFHNYSNLNHLEKYTGKILIGADPEPGYHGWFGYQNLCHYNILKECDFKKGVLISVQDCSDIAREMRNIIDQKMKDIVHGQCFSFTYKNSFDEIKNLISLKYNDKLWWLKEFM